MESTYLNHVEEIFDSTSTKPIGPEPVISGPIPSSRHTGYSPAAIELMGFKKGIKREIAELQPRPTLNYTLNKK